MPRRRRANYCRLAHFKIVSFERNKNVKNRCDLHERKISKNFCRPQRISLTEGTGKMESRASKRDCDVAVTSAYWETVIGKSYSQPEKELMLAVLKDAIIIYKKQFYSGNALFKEAETWLFDRERDWLFSFGTVCAVLALSSEKIRQNLLAWKLNALSAVIDRGRQSRCDQMILLCILVGEKS